MDTMEIDDSLYISKNLVTHVDLRASKASRHAAACLGVLCALLLAGNIGQVVFYEIISRCASADLRTANYNTATQAKKLQNDTELLTPEGERLQSGYDALKVEKNQLQITLSEVNKEKDELRRSYNLIANERDEFNVTLSGVKHERDRLRESYGALKRERDRLQASFGDVQRSLEGLRNDHKNLTAGKEQLQAEYSNLQRERGELQTRFGALVDKNVQLESNYSSLKRSRDQLQRSYDTLSMRKSHIESSYNSLWTDKDQLQARYNALRKEKVQLEANYSRLEAGRGQQQRSLNKMMGKVRGMLCQKNWTKFDTSCYLVSSQKKNWTASREACMAEGADLLVIESFGEQIFVNGLLKKGENAWIGLTDSIEEGSWLWVDGTPLTTEYWQRGQPNDYHRNQDCGEYVQMSATDGGKWNDDGCFADQMWICEK
ncbi:C-type lectin domain family 4 member M-like isoform X1 [Mugil cephalus]|uniref:C-type lectin domain family 4 member M-like isoform X1 n=1 Tax=Mugil cephalus TaxID=48193 RepID=UPI001FB6AB6C|nr:C-type lectin domain family 4 member M-like isoform X1 [Mugil cephalus]